jgi:uncharacterized membrane protein
LSTLLFADDQIIIADTEVNLQKTAHKLNRPITEYDLTITVQKTKSMAFKGRDPVRTKTVRQQNDRTSKIYERELDIDNRLNNYLKITRILYNLFSVSFSTCPFSANYNVQSVMVTQLNSQADRREHVLKCVFMLSKMLLMRKSV